MSRLGHLVPGGLQVGMGTWETWDNLVPGGLQLAACTLNVNVCSDPLPSAVLATIWDWLSCCFVDCIQNGISPFMFNDSFGRDSKTDSSRNQFAISSLITTVGLSVDWLLLSAQGREWANQAGVFCNQELSDWTVIIKTTGISWPKERRHLGSSKSVLHK